MNKSIKLSRPTKYLANAFVDTCGLDILPYCTFTDGVVPQMANVLNRGGPIFTDDQTLSDQFESSDMKYRVICITGILRLRSKNPRGPYNDILAKITTVLDPSTCVLALGTWPQLAAKAIDALSNNTLSAAMIIICPLLEVPEETWEMWFWTITNLVGPIFLAIQTAFGGTDLAGVALNSLSTWSQLT